MSKQTKGRTVGERFSDAVDDVFYEAPFLVLALLAVFAAAAVSMWLNGLGVLSSIETVVRPGLFIIVPVVLVALGTVLLLYDISKSRMVGGIVFLLGVAFTVYALGFHSYNVKSVYASDMQEVDETVNYNERSPWVVADNFARRGQGDINGDLTTVRFVPNDNAESEDVSRYSAAIKERKIFNAGYAAVQTMDMPYSGAAESGAVSHCEVPDNMGKRLGSFWPWASLNWTLYRTAPLFSHFHTSDAYAYCDSEDKPTIVVPLYSYSGFWRVTKEPAGVFVYNPDGARYIEQSKVNGEGIEGTTYPMSLAKTQREAIKAGGTLRQYYSSVYGYDTTDKDVQDSNGSNPSEFILTKPNGGGVSFVTPLTPRGSSESIVAVADIPARQEGEGRSPVIINTNPDLQASTSTLDTKIRESSVRGDVEWATRWSAGMRVYEILPASDGHWTASVGQGQAVSYRADISPNGEVRVYRTDDESGSDTEVESVTVSGDKELKDMSDEELYSLIDSALEELKAR
jgi:hypothetical protein